MTRAPDVSEASPESRNSEGRIRGASDARSVPRVDGRAEEGLDPAVPPRAPGEGGEVRVPNPPRAPGSVERVLRPEGGDALPGATAPRRARIRGEPLAGAGERRAEEVLSADGPRPDRPLGSPGHLGRHDRGRRTRPGGRAVTAQDEYLNQVRRSMMGMAPAVREDILR